METALPQDNYLPRLHSLEEKMSGEKAVTASLGKFPVGWF